MPNQTLFDFPRTPASSISLLRKSANKACEKFAKYLKGDADTLWQQAMWNEFPPETFDCQEGQIFYETFMDLNRAEVSEIENRRKTPIV